MFRKSFYAVTLTALLAIPACSSPEVPIGNEYAVATDLLPNDVVDVDLLFVIDDSGSMAEEQASLAEWAQDALFGVLEIDEGTPLNLHVAVVSTDMGAGPFDISSCEGTGDQGVFQDEGDGVCATPSDPYIIDIDDGAGGRVTNYTGTLAESFGCIAGLGVQGCGFEQPLEAMKRALDGSNAANTGFLREDALLAVVLVSDEDDCSVSDTNLFDPSQSELSDPLGPLTSFRCFEFGVVCDDDDPRTPGAKQNCHSREDSAYLTPVSEYADFLKSLKADPTMVVAAAITGTAGPVEVTTSDDGNPTLAPSCSSMLGQAYPAVRLQEFVESFPDRHKFSTICDSDLADPLARSAERITSTALRRPCLSGELRDVDPTTDGLQVDCRMTVQSADGQIAIPSCAEQPDASRCFTISSQPSICATETGLAFAINGDPAPAGHTVLECLRPE